MLVSEGGVEFEVPAAETDGKGEGVFFNPQMEFNRDLTVAALDAYRDREPRAETYLDAMAASGVRGVRAAAADWEVTMADVDPDAVARSRANLDRNGLSGKAIERDANALLHDRERVFDVVDLDPFGTPIPFADAAFANARNLVCVTATDTAPLCGAHFRSGVRTYSAVPRNTEYHAEMGLRVLLSALARTAARYDVGVTPLFSHVSDHYVRTYLDLAHSATDANGAVDALGFLSHCPECLHREHEYGLTPHAPRSCPACGSEQVLAAGPLWLERPHDPDFVRAVGERATGEMGTAERASALCERIAGELDAPTHYDQHRLYSRWGEPAPAMAGFLDALRADGHEASRTHYGGTTFKTTASVAAIEAAVL
jgi:tRNA (guanine26-N2/guanine27-N2)-dimethyltransferase